VNLARFLGLNAEVAMVSVNERFERRFREMEKIAAETGCSIENAGHAHPRSPLGDGEEVDPLTAPAFSTSFVD